MFVCHSCDNRKCINVEHLFLGSPKDNTRDMMSKNRHTHRLERDEVWTIKALISLGVDRPWIAKTFGVNTSLIRQISMNKKWVSVAWP